MSFPEPDVPRLGTSSANPSADPPRSPGDSAGAFAGGGLAGLPSSLEPAAGGDRPVANLAHVLAHRMRGPLTSIQCYTDLLADDLGSAEHRDMALRIFECAFALEGMLADLQRFTLDVSPVPRPVHPAELVTGLLVGLGEEAEHVTLDATGGGDLFMADGILVRQALLILLRNALEAEAELGDKAAPPVRLALHDEPDALRFEVWNPGPLVEPDRVFEPFYTTKSANLGIGLCIARRIAEAHDGALTHTADEGGVTFTLCIPKRDDVPAHPFDFMLPE